MIIFKTFVLHLPCECICGCVSKSVCMSLSLLIYITKCVFIMISSSNARVAFNCNSCHMIKSTYASTFNMSKRSFYAYLCTKFISVSVCALYFRYTGLQIQIGSRTV